MPALSELQRYSQLVRVKLGVHFVLAILSFYIFVLQGLFPMIGVIMEKISLTQKAKELSIQLDKSVLELRKTGNILNSSENLFEPFSDIMPSNPQLETYLSEVFLATSKSGYYIRNISSKGEMDAASGQVPISLELNGKGDLSRLSSNIESLKRISTINKLSAKEDYALFDVMMDITIYFVPREGEN